MLFKTEYDYENDDKYCLLNLEIEYDLHPAEKRTREEPGCEAYIAIYEVKIIRARNSAGDVVALSDFDLKCIQEEVNKVAWDEIISEDLADTEDFLRSEYYDRKRDEAKGF